MGRGPTVSTHHALSTGLSLMKRSRGCVNMPRTPEGDADEIPHDPAGRAVAGRHPRAGAGAARAVLFRRQRVRSDGRDRQALRSRERGRQDHHRQGALQGRGRDAAGAARRRRRPRRRPRGRPGRPQQVLSRPDAAPVGRTPEGLERQLLVHAGVVPRRPGRQGHLRPDVAAHRDRRLRQQDAVRPGQGADARRQGHLGRLDGRRRQGGQGHQDAVRDGDGPQRPPLRAAGRGLRRTRPA
jgi:hypothetical protein